MQLTRKIAIAAGALTLGATGVAAAVTTPDEAEPGLTTASEKAGFEVPVGPEAEAGDEVTEVEAEDVESDDVEAEGEGTGPVDNHGAAVSAVAKSDFDSGREHGEAVSAIARTNGGGDAATASDADDEGDEDEGGEELDDAAADEAEVEGDDAGERGRP
jgi:hypothetical protein